MATESKSNIRLPQGLSVPRRIFAEELVAYLAGRDEPVTAFEAEVAGPWHVEPDPLGGWGVLGEGESVEAGDAPVVTFLRKELAMIAAAVLPGTGRAGGDASEEPPPRSSPARSSRPATPSGRGRLRPRTAELSGFAGELVPWSRRPADSRDSVGCA